MEVSPPDQIVFHVDMDCFYASCERRRDSDLEGEPVVVGMGYEPGETHGAVATASYEAREHGIESGEAISTALDKLPANTHGDEPEGIYLPVDMEYYESVSEEVMDVLDNFSDVLRAESIDEAYLDVSEKTTWSDAETYASQVKATIKDDIGVPASIGVGPTMNVAKIASDHDKPDGLVVVPRDEVESFLHPLPVESLHGVGPVTRRELTEMGVETVGDLAQTDPSTLTELFGERGKELYRRSRGADQREVTPKDDPKSLSRETAFDDPINDIEEVERHALDLASDVTERASQHGATYQTVGVKVVEPPFEIHTREKSLSGPVDDPDLVADIVRELLQEFEDMDVRKIGVKVSNLSFADGNQSTLEGWAVSESSATHPRLSTPDKADKKDGDQTKLTDFDS